MQQSDVVAISEAPHRWCRILKEPLKQTEGRSHVSSLSWFQKKKMCKGCVCEKFFSSESEFPTLAGWPPILTTQPHQMNGEIQILLCSILRISESFGRQTNQTISWDLFCELWPKQFTPSVSPIFQKYQPQMKKTNLWSNRRVRPYICQPKMAPPHFSKLHGQGESPFQLPGSRRNSSGGHGSPCDEKWRKCYAGRARPQLGGNNWRMRGVPFS